MLKYLVEKLDNINKQMGNFRNYKETIKNKQI